MSMSGHLRLQWHEHGTELVDLTRDLCGQSELTDVTLTCSGGVTFSAHRLVLAGASNYFRSTFQGMPVWKHPVIFLKDVSANEMEYFLQFIYFGEVSVPAKELESVISVAKELGIKGLDTVPDDQDTPASSSKKPFGKKGTESSGFSKRKSTSSARIDSSLIKKIRIKEEAGDKDEYQSEKEEADEDEINEEDVGHDDDVDQEAGVSFGDGGESDSNMEGGDFEEQEQDKDDEDYKPGADVSSSSGPKKPWLTLIKIETEPKPRKEKKKPKKKKNVNEHDDPNVKMYPGDAGDNFVDVIKDEVDPRKPTLAVNGFMYTISHEGSQKYYFQCKKTKCPAKMQTYKKDFSGFEMTKSHDHPGDQGEVEAFKILKDLKLLAYQNFTIINPRPLVDQFILQIPERLHKYMPTREGMAKIMIRVGKARREELGMCVGDSAKKNSSQN